MGSVEVIFFALTFQVQVCTFRGVREVNSEERKDSCADIQASRIFSTASEFDNVPSIVSIEGVEIGKGMVWGDCIVSILLYIVETTDCGNYDCESLCSPNLESKPKRLWHVAGSSSHTHGTFVFIPSRTCTSSSNFDFIFQTRLCVFAKQDFEVPPLPHPFNCLSTNTQCEV